ncbi:hypothetical protein LguiB_020925 [Lonicera macranthoides]
MITSHESVTLYDELPRRKFMATDLYQWKGFWYPLHFLKASLLAQSNLKARNHDSSKSSDESKDSTGAESWSKDYADPIRVLSGPTTQARAKTIKEALMAMVQEMMSKAEAWRSIEGDGEQE